MKNKFKRNVLSSELRQLHKEINYAEFQLKEVDGFLLLHNN